MQSCILEQSSHIMGYFEHSTYIAEKFIILAANTLLTINLFICYLLFCEKRYIHIVDLLAKKLYTGTLAVKTQMKCCIMSLCGNSSGYVLSAKIKTNCRDRNILKLWNFNLWTLKIQNGQIHAYFINMHEKINQNENGSFNLPIVWIKIWLWIG